MTDKNALKNPLAVALGLVLKQMREESNRSAEDIADTLDVSPSTYRLVEAGSNNLRPVYAPKLLQEDAFREIEFSSLAILLQAIHSLDAIRKDKNELADALQEIINLGSPLSRLISKLKEGLQTEGDPGNIDVRAVILRTEVNRHLRRLLTTPTFSQELETQAELTTKRFLNEVSPFYFDTAIRLLLDLKRSEPQLQSSKLGEWEAENAERMTEVKVVVRDLGTLFHKGNFEDFDFRYILNRVFSHQQFSVDILYQDITSHSPNFIKPTDFKKRLARTLRSFYTWKTNEGTDVARGKLDRIINNTFVFAHISNSSVDVNEFLRLKNRGYEHNNLWMFKLSPLENIVAVADNAKPEDIDIRLSSDGSAEGKKYGELINYRESMRRFSLFKDIWNNIDTSDKHNLDNMNINI